MTQRDGSDVIHLLKMRLHALNDLALTLKHIHWNVVGPHFIAVHEMLDPQVESVRKMTDTTAERISTLGGSPHGTPGALVAERHWEDYSIGRAESIEHLGALDMVYAGIIEDHRTTARATDESDPVTQDMLIEQLRDLELFQWFVRAHLESAGGSLSTGGASSERDAASKATKQARKQP
ncbi:MAG TPA: DNA starvation/stationary phase protection protein [Streptomyces sp.]|nr:DNA starvation/stationary phase protection protein [Streptomyces sp.]